MFPFEAPQHKRGGPKIELLLEPPPWAICVFAQWVPELRDERCTLGAPPWAGIGPPLRGWDLDPIVTCVVRRRLPTRPQQGNCAWFFLRWRFRLKRSMSQANRGLTPSGWIYSQPRSERPRNAGASDLGYERSQTLFFPDCMIGGN